MSNLISWFQYNWMEAIMLTATLIAVVSSIFAVRIAILALGVARQSVLSADTAHERDVRLQARSALADVRGSYQKLASDCDLNLEKWQQHERSKGMMLSANPFEPTKEEQETGALRAHGAQMLRSVDEKFRSIDQMNLDDLESGIPEIRQTAASIDALARRLREPKETSTNSWR
ncbi:hypothetical protein [Ruegeria arenilitoris]|uniref:hypothetical protein n=1 Tax=Ruegeria arenilitoris TaxID=1173585 RepID=UPI00148183AB|nr:hypothetical protein [Ruegeria arenilitoris]